MNIAREVILQERTQKFIKDLSNEFGDPIYGALLVVQYKDTTASAIVMAQAPTHVQKNVLNTISKVFVKVIEQLRIQLNTFHKDVPPVLHHMVKPKEENTTVFNDEDEIK